MGFLCINKGTQLEVPQEEINEVKLLRDIGLDPVYNLQPTINVCSEMFKSPEFYVSGATTLTTGLTMTLTGCTSGMTGIYNLDYTPDFNIYFNITGGTDYTGYTGNFCFKLFSDKYFTANTSNELILKGSETLNSCTSFSAITSSTVVQQFLEGGLPKTWSQYMIRPYYGFTTKDCNPGMEFNTWDTTTQYTSFNVDNDYYFMTVVNPPKPQLNPPGGNSIPNYTLITDRLYVNGISGQRGFQSIGGDLNYFILSSIPTNGTLILSLNGVQLTDKFDYNLISQGYGIPPIVELKQSLKWSDWLLATYIVGVPETWSTNFGIYFMDQIVLPEVYATVDATPDYRQVGDNLLNFNSITNNYEFFTSLPIDPTFSLVVSINGVKMAENAQYFKSTSFDGRIIFNKENTTFKKGDVITVLAVSKKGGDNYNYGSQKTNQFLAQWNVPSSFTNDKVSGRFIVQAYDLNTNLLTNQGYVDFVEGQSNYEFLLTNLTVGIYYYFTVKFEATYKGYLNNNVITCSISDGYFDYASDYAKNTY